MTRIILSSLAVVAMLATSAAPAASQAKLSGQQPVPCDCTNCSAEHCPKPGSPNPSKWDAFQDDDIPTLFEPDPQDNRQLLGRQQPE